MAKLVVLVVLAVQMLLAAAELSSNEKQFLLDLHNVYRASNVQTAVRILEWNSELEGKAKEYVESCDAVDPPVGFLQFYNTSSLSDDMETRYGTVFEEWIDKPNTERQVLSRRSTRLACAEFFCNRLPITVGSHTPNALFIACAYNPRFFDEKDNTKTICSTNGGSNACPSGARNCLTIPSDIVQNTKFEVNSRICAPSDSYPEVAADPITETPEVTRRVTWIEQRFGSIAGGHTTTIHGQGFSASNFNGANEVYFVRDDERIPCDVNDYSSSSVAILCVTRASSITIGEATYSIEVYVTVDGVRERVTDICSGCTYVYHYYSRTPIIQDFRQNGRPTSAITFGETVTIYGKLYSIGFQDTADSESDEALYDHFTRLLVGGLPCEHMPNNDTEYFAEIDAAGQYASIECLPSTAFNLGTMNISVFTQDRGASAHDPNYFLVSYDNKFQPYTFVTHADILDVSPRFGSRAGGTQIFITLNTPLENYTDIDTVKVRVGGVPCMDVAFVTSFDNVSVITCTTGPEPPPSTYYPGGRGMLRELWDDRVSSQRTYSLSELRNLPRTDRTATHDRAFLHSDFVSDYGELYYIGHRFSGFFVPPVTSLYTFGVRSDDGSALFLSPNASSDNILDHEIAIAPGFSQRSWTHYDTQTSEPVLLKEGEYYYFMLTANQGVGPWNIAIGAKVHNLSYNAPPYIGDDEQQLVTISSTVVKEKHTINLEARPFVQTITVIDTNSPSANSTVFCPIPLSLGSVNLTISRDMLPEALEDHLNSEELVQGVGEVKVFKEYYNSDYSVFENSLDVQFTIVFLTVADVEISDIPQLSLRAYSEVLGCDYMDAQTNTTSDYEITASVDVVQNLQYPSDFRLRFNQDARYSPSLYLNATGDELHDEITDLFAWGCDSDVEALSEQGRVFLQSDFENSNEGSRVNDTSFCGHYSDRNPFDLFRDTWTGQTPFNPNQYRYMCFAYKGNHPQFRVWTSYTKVIEELVPGNSVPVRFGSPQDNILTRIEQCSSYPFSSSQTINFDSDGWSDYQCVNVLNCLEEFYPDGIDFEINRVRFSNSPDFWLDEFVISSAEVAISRRQDQQPVIPNGVNVNYIEVQREASDIPELRVTEKPIQGSGDEDLGVERGYTMVLSQFHVEFTPHDCGYGMEPMEGYYGGNQDPIYVEQVARGSPPVTGTFDLTFEDLTIKDIPADVDGATMEMLLEANLPYEGSFVVTRDGSCSGYNWNIRWDTKGGDIQPIVADASNLEGDEPEITMTTLVDGGTWLRPIGGEMLRQPMDEPQVEVIIDGTPSSCRGGMCSFTYDDEATPTIQFIYPYEGQGGEEITIYGSGFSNDTSNINVTIGNVPCTLVSANSTQITCTLSDHSAGYYEISVLIEGMGVSVSSNASCFHYLLIVDSVTPSNGGTGGGQPIQIRGKGFLDFSPIPAKYLDTPFSYLPWFQHGFGIPTLESLDGANICPAFQEYLYKFSEMLGEGGFSAVIGNIADFARERESNRTDDGMPGDLTDMPFDCEGEDCSFDSDFSIINDGQFVQRYLILHLLNIYYHMPSQVLLNDVPCIIVESNIEEITCVPVISFPSTTNLTVSVFSDETTLPSGYEFSTSATPVIYSIDPLQGAVTGGMVLTITGSNFGASVSSDVNVTIGDSACQVQFANDSLVECMTAPSDPNYELVFVLTPNGVAVLDSVSFASGFGSGMQEEFGPFPVFEYKLVVYVTNAVASTGSVFGGTVATIEGGVFASGYTQVLVGGQEAELQAVTTDTIEFVTPSSATTHYVKLERSQFRVSRLTGQLSVDLFWEMEDIQIQIGDTIVWELSDDVHDFSSNLQSVEVGLNLGSDLLTSILIPTDYSSSFQFTFRRIGNFSLSSFAVPGFEITDFPITVTGPQPSFNEVQVLVGGRAAIVMERGGLIAKRQADDCDVPAPEIEGTIVVEYSPCLTPAVTSVEPKTGFRLDTVFTIQGSLFSDTSEYNKVEFGGYPCTPLTSNDTTITCIMGADSGMPPTFTELQVSVRVVDLGYAYLVNEDELYITLQSYITEVFPAYGSLEGGNDLIISGDGFPTESTSTLTVSLGSDQLCTVTSYSYNEVRCTSEASELGSDQEVTVMITTNSATIDMQTSACMNDCNFTYSDTHTPKVQSVSPLLVDSTEATALTITGSGFVDSPSSTNVMFGDVHGYITDSNSTTITVQLFPQPANSYPVSVRVCNATGWCSGYARVLSAENTTVVSVASVISVSPDSGSVGGGTELSITGRGFNDNPDDVQVLIGNSNCEIQSVNYSQIICTTSANEAGSYSVQVSITGLSSFPEAVMYNYSMASTPIITGISPTSGNVGDTITLSGSGLSGTTEGSSVFFDEAECEIMSIIDSSITCSPENYFVGTYTPEVTISGIGAAEVSPNVNFTFELNLGEISPTEGSYAGLSALSIEGSGFFPSDIDITLCGLPCPLSTTTPSLSLVECILPPMDTSNFTGSSVLSCDVTVSTNGATQTLMDAYTYREDLTPRVTGVDRNRGGTAGGSVLQVTGQGFNASAAIEVTIAGSVCEISSQSETDIICRTGASGRNVRASIMVHIEGMGFALSDVEFWYVDLWSSPFTWQGGIIPSEGDFVVVPRGQTLVLDVVTPVLGYILIQGGTLIFDPEKDDNEVELHTQGGLITSDGVFQVGTEDEPFMAKTQIVLYGHVLSTEIPSYGAKTLALRRGTLDIHGRTINVTWTKLSATTAPGDNQIYLQDYVDWEVGGTLVIASTSFSQRENEEKVIQSIEAGSDGSIITLTEPLEYEHISIQQTIAGRYIDTSAEVGYLTRNVVIRGNVNEEWLEDVPACPEEFRVGQFDLQTCFQGRFGRETLSDQFGSQVMIHAAEQNQGHVTARFGYVEVTHAGQAFRLGRYPIHFHLNGDVTGSYVRGCGIHHTFNRAVTMHAVDHLLVEKNVAFNIMGHAYFLEDGIEQHNIIQDNLGIFVRASSSLLNVDITPATFWVVNPNNILRRNAAAGGTHFGFWYRLPQNPEGPSATNTVCPRKLPLEEFSDNSAHSFGWFGIWVFRQYHPTVTGNCFDNTPAPAYFDRFLSWRNDKGLEFEQVGALQVRDSIFLDNREAGIEITDVNSTWSGEDDDGPLVKDTLIVGYSNISTQTGARTCSESGIKTPHSYYLTVSNVTFVNFNRDNCYPVQPCSFCRHPFQGGFETRFKQITYINEGSEITKWNYFHEHAQRDLDGTLTKTGAPSVLLASSNTYPQGQDQCEEYEGSHTGAERGMICDGNMEFGRIGIHTVKPDSLQTSQLELSSDHGTDSLPYATIRFRGGPGQMAILPLNDTYQLTWVEGVNLTNITYSIVTAGFEEDDWVRFRQQYPRPLDFTSIRGITTATNTSTLNDPAVAETGDWTLLDNTTLLYIVKGMEALDPDISITFSTYRCFYENCIPPPPPTEPPLATIPPPRPEGRPDVTQSWSNSSIWPNGQLPQEGDNVVIPGDMYVVVDEEIPHLGRLVINGGLELDDTIDHMIEADYLIVDGGRFAIGYPDTPFQHKATIMLHGDQSSEEIGNTLRRKRNFFTNVGAKALAVFGDLIMYSETRTPTWTTLAATATVGGTFLQLTDPVTWQEGDEIVITSTSYDAYETEVFKIVNVIDSTTIELNDTLQFEHSGGYFSSLGSDKMYTTRAEVGLLTRNIVITNDDNAQSDAEAFGCRVVVSQNEDFTARAWIQGVEFVGCGQLGYTQPYDPRFALAILNIDDSYVRDCSMHDGYNTGIGVFDSNRVDISGNVIHRTVGPSIIARGSEHNITYNLASLSRFLATFRRNDQLFEPWTANFEVTEVSALRMIGNAAAGGAKVGFHTNGEDCTDPSTVIEYNTAHSSLHCIHLEYGDGLPSGCSQFRYYNLFSCYFFGLFSFSRSGVHVYDSTFTNNKAAVLSSVIGPASLSHMRGTKTVKLERVLIISASEEFGCEDDNVRPVIADHFTSHSGILSKSGGHLGLLIPNFLSGGGHYPEFAWWTITSYPAIAGFTQLHQVTFANFHQRCGDQLDTALRSNPASEDANHPVDLSEIQFVSDSRFTSSINPTGKLWVNRPHLGSVNPSDCVDMDCDGYKQMVLRDIGGTFTETGSDCSIISEAEFEWDGNPSRGLGDFRIPKTMLTHPNGSRIPVDDIYPAKGIQRSDDGFADEQYCEFNEDWVMYVCRDIEHVMLILESLDADTEVRRLSPVGIGANGFINLVNGPQDNGWCGGYTCQERISTFFSIVATGLHYTIALTSTNPQNFAMYMLNAREDQTIVSCVVYTNPQRLDVYYNGVYIVPKNAERMENGNLRYLDGTNEEFTPLLTDDAGTNFYNRDTKQLCITMTGDGNFIIETTPVIVLSINVQVTVDSFFDEDTIVRNIALLLGISDDKIRIVSVSRETSRRKRQEDEADSEGAEIEFEIGDPPQETIEMSTEAPDTGMNTTMNMTDSGTTNTTDDDLSFEELEDLSEMVVNIVLTGEIVDALNVSANLTSAAIDEPQPPPVDETGGVRATPETGGPQPEDFANSTDEEPMTFSETQRIQDELEQNSTVEPVFSIPTTLQIISEPTSNEDIIEGYPLSFYAPIVAMLDNNGEVVVNLGLQVPWILTVQIASTNSEVGFVAQQHANFTEGHATFSELIFSHPGEYVLSYFVSYPDTADFGISSTETIVVRKRELSLHVYQQPGDGNTTFTLFPYPVVMLRDLESEETIAEDNWRNSTWIVTATVMLKSDEVDSYQVYMDDGVAIFDEISFTDAGEYIIQFEAHTVPAIGSDYLPVSVYSDYFTVREPQRTKLDITYEVDFNSTIGGREDEFIEEFTNTFLSAYPNVEIIEITLTEGSIIVGVIITARNPQQLLSLLQSATVTSNFDALTFTFNNTMLSPANVTQDPHSNYTVVLPTAPPSILREHFILILATVIPGVVLIISFFVLICVCCFVYKHKRNKKSWDHNNKVSPLDEEERYATGPRPTSVAGSSVDEYYLLSEKNVKNFETRSFESHELDSLASTPASQRKVDVVVTESVDVKVRARSVVTPPPIFFSNPGAEEALKEEEKLGTLDTNFDEVVHSTSNHLYTNTNGNNNNNNSVAMSRPSTSSTMAPHASVPSEGKSLLSPLSPPPPYAAFAGEASDHGPHLGSRVRHSVTMEVEDLEEY